jgi:PEP-CTERM motif-containing protein
MKRVALCVVVLTLMSSAFANSNLFAIQNGRMVDLDNNPMLHPSTYLMFRGIGLLPILELGFRTGTPGPIMATLFVGSFMESGSGVYFGEGSAVWAFVMDATAGSFMNSDHRIRGRGTFVAFNGTIFDSARFRYRQRSGHAGYGGGPVSVPEPSSLMLAATALLTIVLITMRRRRPQS